MIAFRLAALLATVAFGVACHLPGLEGASAETPRIVRLEKFYVNTYLVIGDRVVIVDTGNPGAERRIARALAKRSIPTDAVSLIVVTHAHADHAGSAVALKKRFNVPIVLGAADTEGAGRGRNPDLIPTGAPGRRIKALLRRHEFPKFRPDIRVGDAFDLRPYGIDGEVVVVGGHTPGAVAVILNSGDALVGDLVRGGFTARDKPQLHYFHVDTAHAHRSLSRILERGARRLHPGHGHTLSAKDVRRFLYSDEAKDAEQTEAKDAPAPASSRYLPRASSR